MFTIKGKMQGGDKGRSQLTEVVVVVMVIEGRKGRKEKDSRAAFIPKGLARLATLAAS
jgi:hypothetical protein